MENTTRYVRAIQTPYLIGNRSQILGHWIYARTPYRGYGASDLDELDNDIFADVTRTAKKNEFRWRLNETDQGWAYYNSTCFKGVNRFAKCIRIFPSLDGLTDLEKYDIVGKKLSDFESIIHFLCHKKDDDEDLIYIPSSVSVNVFIKNFSILTQSYQPYF